METDITPTSEQRRIAFFVSPHGYGHAARASAVMAAVQHLAPSIRFEIFTQVPAWFFRASLNQPFGYHAWLTDIGLAQKNSLVEDMLETIDRLDSFLPFDSQHLTDLARQLDRLDCELVLCDISPMGIAAAHRTGLRAVLIENFTWDWIYEGYPDYRDQLNRHIGIMRQLFESADFHIQTEPICNVQPADLSTPPVSRAIRSTAGRIRAELNVPEQATMVLLTMGGAGWDHGPVKGAGDGDNTFIVVSGSDNATERHGNVITLARNSGIFHPDLVNACDGVIGKTGYSTLAEVYQAGIPFGYINRPGFRESPVIAAYIDANMHGLPLTEAQLQNGDWFLKLQELLSLPRIRRKNDNGANHVAKFICNLLGVSQP
jgi:hypothetical protein